MGCFTVLKGGKKRSDQSVYVTRVNPKEHLPTILPEPKISICALQSAPSSFRTRVKPIRPVNRTYNNRARTLSAPPTLDVADQDALASTGYDDQEESKSRVGLNKELRSSPQPLPLPSPQGSAVLKTTRSFKSVTSSGPLCASRPLPLPPVGAVTNFSFEEISVACHYFSLDCCVLDGLSSITYIWLPLGMMC